MRRFTITDAMALIGASGVGFAVVREWAGPGFTERDVSLYGRVSSVLAVLTSGCVYSAMMLIFLGLRRPRPPIREVFRQPGMAACLAVAFGSFWYLEEGGWVFIRFFKSPSKNWPMVRDLVLNSATAVPRLAPFIVVAWMILALSGRWEANPGWIDRLGRVIGVTLLGILAIESSRVYYFELF